MAPERKCGVCGQLLEFVGNDAFLFAECCGRHYTILLETKEKKPFYYPVDQVEHGRVHPSAEGRNQIDRDYYGSSGLNA